MGKRKHTTLTISQKTEILDKLKTGMSGKQLALQYGVGTSTISDIKKNKEKIERFLKQCYNGPGKRKTLKNSEYPEMEEELYSWFLLQQNKHMSMSFQILAEKGRQLFRKHYGNDNFLASRGWLLNFKKRHGLRHLTIYGDQLSNDESSVDPFLKKLSEIVRAKGFTASQIYNANETQLFWKKLPDRTVVQSKEITTSSWPKTNEERLTFVACTNVDGTHKLKLLVIGNTEKDPKFFQNKDISVEYMSSTDTWMTSHIFKEWFHKSFLKQVNQFLKRSDLPEKALLLIDNAPSDSAEGELISEDGNIFTLFLPSNCTALIQSKDQNASRLTKLNYRNLLAHIVSSLDGTTDDIQKFIKSINLYDAVYLLQNSWENVSIVSFKKCWNNILNGTIFDYDSEDLIPLNKWQEQCHISKDCYENISNPVTAIDNRNKVTENLHQWVEDTKNVFLQEHLKEEVDDDSCEEQDTEPTEKIKHEEAIKIFSLGLQWANENNIPLKQKLFLEELKEQAIMKLAASNVKHSDLFKT